MNDSKYDATINRLIRDGYEFNFNLYINRGMELFNRYLGGFIGFAAIYIAVAVIAGTVPVLGSLVSLFVTPILTAGFYIVANKIMLGTKPDFNDFFKAFEFFVNLFAASIISGIFIVVGIIALIIPGVYLAVSYTFTSFFVVFLGYEFWPAMEASRKLVTKNWWPVFGFVLVLGLINMVGFLLLGVGALFTVPATACMQYAAFEDIVGNALREDQHVDEGVNAEKTV